MSTALTRKFKNLKSGMVGTGKDKNSKRPGTGKVLHGLEKEEP